MKKYMITYQTVSAQPGSGQAQTRVIECEALTAQVINDFINGKIPGMQIKTHPSQTVAIIFAYPLED